MSNEKSHISGVTPRSVAASIFSLLAAGMITMYSDVIEGASGNYIGHHTLAPPIMMVFVGLLLFVGLGAATLRLRLLTRAELLCVFFATSIGFPLITYSFWYRFIPMTGTIPRTSDFEKIDVYSERLWPHGANLLAGALSEQNPDLRAVGNAAWQDTEYEEGRQAALPVMANIAKDQTSSIRIKAPLQRDGRPHLRLQEPYLVSFLARAKGLGPEASYFCRFYFDENAEFSDEPVTSRNEEKATIIHKKGFVRAGKYGLVLPATIKDHVWIEFGLKGVGRLEIADPKLMSVATLEAMYAGRKTVTHAQYDSLPETERIGLVIKPDSMWSWKGLRFVLSGYIPARDWIEPVASWTAFVVLVLMATFAVTAIMRRQWIDNERYPLPMTKIPLALMGEEEEGDRPFGAIWRNRLMWAGYAAGLFWCVMKAWRLYNSNVPDMTVEVPLRPYLSDPGWGKMWDSITFTVSALFLSLAMFMELNVLISMVIGYFLFKSQHWFGKAMGLDVYPNYPFVAKQEVGSYLAYGLVVLFFSRKYLWRVVRKAVRGPEEGDREEASVYRPALLTLVASYVGIALWAKWIGAGVAGMLLLFSFMLLIALVSAKYRAECGSPFSHFDPAYPVFFLSLLGSVYWFGANTVLFGYIVSFLFCSQCFCLIPGAQVELLELSRRFQVPRRHVVYTCLLGLVGGMVIGGWIFLSAAYALGGNNMAGWAFDEKSGNYTEFNYDLANATMRYEQETGKIETPPPSAAVDPLLWAYVYAAGGTVIVSVLRQLFAGFWFHPLGFVLGTSNLMQFVWGSMLTAWFIRTIVLKLGGAATVRNKLLPFFIGVFLAGVTSYLLLIIYNGYLFYTDPGAERFGMIP